MDMQEIYMQEMLDLAGEKKVYIGPAGQTMRTHFAELNRINAERQAKFEASVTGQVQSLERRAENLDQLCGQLLATLSIPRNREQLASDPDGSVHKALWDLIDNEFAERYRRLNKD